MGLRRAIWIREGATFAGRLRSILLRFVAEWRTPLVVISATARDAPGLFLVGAFG